jgi:dimethylaniline monooxygenase (N-oxide forming)
VTKVERDDAKGKWIVYTSPTGRSSSPQRETFDRLVVATGFLNKPIMPKIEGASRFAGDIIHSREFKNPSKYTGKNVLILGIGGTGADSSLFLKEAGAKNIYISHRGRIYLLSRWQDGKPADVVFNRRTSIIMRFMGSISPKLLTKLLSTAMLSLGKAAFPDLKDHPSLNPPRTLWPAIQHRLPVFPDKAFAESLANGSVKTVTSISGITGPKSVALADGTVLQDIDAIIVCTGYHYDSSVLDGTPGDPLDPQLAPDGYKAIRATKYHSAQDPFPRLYLGLLSPIYPESLAVLGQTAMAGGTFAYCDLFTQAIASLWSGAYPMPSKAEMERSIDKHYKYLVSCLDTAPVPHQWLLINNDELYRFVNMAAGTGVIEKLGNWSLECWKFWWSNRKLYKMMMDGANVASAYRIFDMGRGRKPWEGAKENFEKVNSVLDVMGQEWKAKNGGAKKLT